MAYMTTKTCTTCGENYCGDGNALDSTCGKCRAAEIAVALSAHFAELDKLSQEERIRRIEEWMYFHR